MGIATKKELKQLKPELIRTVFPGDSAVDLLASDLAKWACEGGTAGLVIKDGETPTTFVLRPLPFQHEKLLNAVWAENTELLAAEAFRLGYVGIEGDTTFTPHYGDRGGVRCMAEESFNILGGISMDIPSVLLTLSWTDEMTGVVVERTDDMMDERSLVSLPDALGAQVLAATFRRRRCAA